MAPRPLEDLFAPGGPLSLPRPRTLEEVSAALRRDPRVPAVLEILAGTAAFDLEGTAGRLLAENGLPDLRRWGTAEAHEEQRAMAEYLCARRSCPFEVVDAWRAPCSTRGASAGLPASRRRRWT